MKIVLFVYLFITLLSCQNQGDNSSSSSGYEVNLLNRKKKPKQEGRSNPTFQHDEPPSQNDKEWSLGDATEAYNRFFEQEIQPNLENVLTDFQIINLENDPTQNVLEGMDGVPSSYKKVRRLKFEINGEPIRIDLNKRTAMQFFEDLAWKTYGSEFVQNRIIDQNIIPKLNKVTNQISTYYHFPENVTYIIYRNTNYIKIVANRDVE